MSGLMQTRAVGDATVVAFGPETNLDAKAVEQVRDTLAGIVEQNRGPVVLDFANVAFASSPAIGLLVTLRLKAARTEHRLLLASVADHIADVLEVMQMTQLFEFYPTVDEALAAAAA